MPKITFLNRQPVDVASDANLMDSLLKNEIPVASSCQGKGICGKCRIEVLEGKENLSPHTEQEKVVLEKYSLGKSMRISCQCQILGDIKIHASYW